MLGFTGERGVFVIILPRFRELYLLIRLDGGFRRAIFTPQGKSIPSIL
jgi:hypothetical protein